MEDFIAVSGFFSSCATSELNFSNWLICDFNSFDISCIWFDKIPISSDLRGYINFFLFVLSLSRTVILVSCLSGVIRPLKKINDNKIVITINNRKKLKKFKDCLASSLLFNNNLYFIRTTP